MPSNRLLTQLTAVAALLGLAGWLAFTQWEPAQHASAELSGEPLKERGQGWRHAARLEVKESLEQALMAGHPLRIPADGREQLFTASLSELHLPDLPAPQRLVRFAPLWDGSALLAEAEKKGGGRAELVFYPAGHEGQVSLRHVLKNRLVIEVSDIPAAEATLRALDLHVVERPVYAPGLWIVEPRLVGALATLRAMDQIQARPGIRRVSALMARRRQKEALPNDPLFAQQWHLRNTAVGGADINVVSVWDRFKGDTARIAIVDDGLDQLHPDLQPNLDTLNGYDWNDSPHDTDPSPQPYSVVSVEDNHGTAVAGVAAARGSNGAGVSGVAPLATLVGLRLISSLDDDPDGVSDQDEAEAMAHKNHLIDIKNNSWSAGVPANLLGGPGPLTRAAIQYAAEEGRGGRGTLLVWAGGNDRQEGQQGQKDGYTNSMYGLAVGAVTNSGVMSAYSEGGPHLVVMAPSSGGTRSIWTTDLRGNNGYNRAGPAGGQPADRNYTATFGGTSAAAPVISGVIALMLNANPLLNWRDVKEIFLRTSIRINPADAGWLSRHGGDPSLPLIRHHEDYGGGRVDAAAAVAMAEGWQSLGPALQITRSDTTARAIPDYSSTGTNAGISIPFDFSAAAALRVEHVSLSLKLTHSFRGDLSIRLISPEGVVSNLALRTAADNGWQGYDDWIFTSVRHWGELSTGVWTLNIRDLAARDRGDFQRATLTLHGTDAAAPTLLSQTTGPFFLRAGDSLALEGEGTGGGRVAYIWSRDGVPLAGNSSRLEIPSVQVNQAGNYVLNVMNAGGAAPSVPIAVGVVGSLPVSALVVQGQGYQIQAPAAGPGLSFEWCRDGQPLEEGGGYSGVNAPTLRLASATASHAGSYTCRVRMAGHPQMLESSALQLNVLLRPVMNPPAFGNAVRGSTVQAAFTASQSPTSYRLRGRLPTGVRFNAATGQFTGRPTSVGSYTLFVSAVNAAGVSDEMEMTWVVEEFPPEVVGSWRALADRNEEMNRSLAGSLALTITPTGSYSARLVMGAQSFGFSGPLDALPARASFTTPFRIQRGRSLPALTGSFTLDPGSGLLTGVCGLEGQPSSLTPLGGHRCPWKPSEKVVTSSTTFHVAAQIPPGGLEALDDAYPHGTGWLVLTLSTTGTLTWAGRLADDTALSGSTLIGPTGQFGIHQMLYASQGSIRAQGGIQLGSGLVEGSLSWMKWPILRSPPRSYGGGIPLHTLQLRGAMHQRPGRDEMLLGLAEPGPPPLDQNARMLFKGAASLQEPLQQDIQVTKAGTAKVPTTATLNPQNVRVTLTASNGLFSGTFRYLDEHPFDPRKPKILRNGLFRGLVIRRPGLDQGIGYFTLPRLPEDPAESPTATPILSGMAELLPP